MTGTWIKRCVVLLLCMGLSSFWAAAIRSDSQGAVMDLDFAQIYYGARSVMQHEDPYDGEAPLRAFESAGLRFRRASSRDVWGERMVMAVAVNLPTTFFVAVPITMMGWSDAQFAWLFLISGLLTLAALLMWDLAGARSPVIGGVIASFMMLNCEVVLYSGNIAGISVGLCVIAAWCLFKERFSFAAPMVLALSLVTKPHDAGFVWLYFCLAGGAGRKRAVQTLAVVGVLVVCTAIWIAPSSPHWAGELHSHLASVSAQGGTQDPGPTGFDNRGFSPIIDLQNTVSVFRNDARFYNPVSFLIVGGLILAWAVAVQRKRTSREGSLLALAAVSPLSLLPVYHLPYDAKLLLLTIPACAMLWAGGGLRRWIALGLTSSAIFVTSDVPLIFFSTAVRKLQPSAVSIWGKLELLVLQPAPLVLLATGCFYLWVYLRYRPSDGVGSANVVETAAVSAA